MFCQSSGLAAGSISEAINEVRKKRPMSRTDVSNILILMFDIGYSRQLMHRVLDFYYFLQVPSNVISNGSSSETTV